jgi:hypothetical protein
MHLLTVAPFAADEPTIGASGAISAVLGAFFVFWPGVKLRCLFFSMLSFRPLIIQAPAALILGLWFAGQLVYSLKLVGDMGNVAFWAHVSGFVAGAGMGTVFLQLRQRELHHLADALKRPLLQAWEALRRGDTDTAGALASEVDENAIEDNQGNSQFLRGLAAMGGGDTAGGSAHLLKAFARARDYWQDAAVVSVYLHLLRNAADHPMPAAFHKDAGLAAFALRHRDVALPALARAVRAGCTEGVEPMRRAAQAILGKPASC